MTDQPLDEAAHEASVTVAGAGAVVSFRGVVRNHDHGRGVVELEYQGHPSAAAVLGQVVAEFAGRPGVLAVAASHRVGVLRPGELALIASVASAHRGEAFAACADLIDEIKRRLPIWKRQVFTDGTDEWVNCP